MTRLRRNIGRVGQTINLVTRFTVNGELFNPYNIVSVKIQDVQGNVISSLSAPTNTSIGVYQASWSVPAGTAPAVYYDVWVWQAQSDMTTQTRTYSFRVDGNYVDNCDVIKKHTGPLFVTPKELNFFNQINKELIQRIVAQEIIYYSVSEELTKTNKLYDEAINKAVYSPVRVNALVMYKSPNQTTTKFTIDTVYAIECYFHIYELRERNLIPREGDFLQFGNTVYEIEKLTRPQITFGQIDHEVMVKAECRVSRKSQFDFISEDKS